MNIIALASAFLLVVFTFMSVAFVTFTFATLVTFVALATLAMQTSSCLACLARIKQAAVACSYIKALEFVVKACNQEFKA